MSVVVMGVSGSGKSTVGVCLAQRLGLRFVDADTLHPVGNVAKMAAGSPLDDHDRSPWLDAVGRELSAGSLVLACSALKRRYRDQLRNSDPGFTLVYLRGAEDVLAQRMAMRGDHFMPASLLQSQIAALEPPADDEAAITIDATRPLDAVIAEITAQLA